VTANEKFLLQTIKNSTGNKPKANLSFAAENKQTNKTNNNNKKTLWKLENECAKNVYF